MGSGGSSPSQSSSKPWEAQQPYLKEIYSLAQNLLGDGVYEYGERRDANMTPQLDQALRMVQNRAEQGSPGLAAAKNMNQRTVEGDYLSPDSNPYLSQTYDAAAQGVTRNFQESVMPTLNSRFAMGRTQQDAGGNAQTAAMGRAQNELGQNLGNLATGIYGGNYQQERGRQMQAGQQAQGFAQSDYMDAQALQSVGQTRQEFAQRALDDIIARFQYGQHAPAEKLAEYSGFIGAPVTTSRSKSSAVNASVLFG